uniref:Ig-like domain-containing protein n=1 Tax=Paramormyrops kingsleyae TaxID=1676925 RepID=A0A3B3QYU4_9TELE
MLPSIIFCFPGALDINYPLSPVCAVTGSTVVIPCEFAYPQSLRVETFMWCHNDVHCEQGRAECLGDKVRNCMLKINDITDTDAGVYRFRFTSNGCEQCGQRGVALRVGELKVVITSSAGSRTLTEGDSVNLTCDTESCSLSQSEFTWFKDNQPITETRPTLLFNPVSYHHTGKYSCALKGYRGTLSNPILLLLQCEYFVRYSLILTGAIGTVLMLIPLAKEYLARRKLKKKKKLLWSNCN